MSRRTCRSERRLERPRRRRAASPSRSCLRPPARRRTAPRTPRGCGRSAIPGSSRSAGPGGEASTSTRRPGDVAPVYRERPARGRRFPTARTRSGGRAVRSSRRRRLSAAISAAIAGVFARVEALGHEVHDVGDPLDDAVPHHVVGRDERRPAAARGAVRSTTSEEAAIAPGLQDAEARSGRRPRPAASRRTRARPARPSRRPVTREQRPDERGERQLVEGEERRERRGRGARRGPRPARAGRSAGRASRR